MRQPLLALALAVLMAAPAHAGPLDKAKAAGAWMAKNTKRVVLFIPRFVRLQAHYLPLTAAQAWYSDELDEAFQQ